MGSTAWIEKQLTSVSGLERFFWGDDFFFGKPTCFGINILGKCNWDGKISWENTTWLRKIFGQLLDRFSRFFVWRGVTGIELDAKMYGKFRGFQDNDSGMICHQKSLSFAISG